VRTWTSLLLLTLPTVALAEHPAGAVITDAATLDVSPGGFDAITGILPELLPPSIDIPEISESDPGQLGQCWLAGYEFSLSNAWVDVGVSGARLVPRPGRLDLDIDLTVKLNEVADPFRLYIEAECIGDTCWGYVEPFNANVSTTLGLAVVTGADGKPAIDATVGQVVLDYDLSGANIHLDDCWIGTVEDVLNWFGISIYDLLLSVASGFIDDIVTDFGPEIETILEDALGAATIEQEMDLAGVTLDLGLYPAEIDIADEGVRIWMDGYTAVSSSGECVAEWDEGGSLETASDPWDLGDVPAEAAGYHAGLNLSDDFGNQALYSLWRGGLLCQTVDAELTGFPLDTSILGLLAGDAFDDLFPESGPLVIQTRPMAPPTLVFDAEHDVGIDVQALGLDFFAGLDGREALIVGMDLTADAGIDLAFDNTTGELAIDVALESEDVTAVVVANEFKPGTEGDIEDNFAGVFNTLVSPILDGLISDLAFALPGFSGLGLTDLQLHAAGDQGDWLGGYAQVGPVSYESAGCDDEGGCGGGCEGGGCSTSGKAGGRLALFAMPLALVFLRRRKDD
jgi:hypothetical protein